MNLVNTCPHCLFSFPYGRSFGAHKTNCRSNPNYERRQELIRQKRKVEKISYKLCCHTCCSSFEEEMTLTTFSKKTNFFCSRSCANTRAHSLATRAKTSRSLAGRKIAPEFVTTQCVVCSKTFQKKRKSAAATCSLACRGTLISTKVTGKTGGYRTRSGKSKFHGADYNGTWLDSGWEVRLARHLDKLNIKWSRGNFIPYRLGEKQRKYYPDFYLNDFDSYIEVKGYWTDESRTKISAVISQNPITLIILNSIEEIDNFSI